jgi:anthranilate synthase/phosphoribosyltransferase
MGIRHREFTLEGVQFHPESIASEDGKTLLKNFIHYRREPFVATEQLQKVIAGDNMSANEAEAFMTELTEGNLSDAQIAGFLTALSTKGIVAEEIAGCARVLQQKRVPVKSDRPLLDTCGTGGDGLGTFNISSMSAIIAASCGAVVAKHGNRAVSSKSGSADFYRALGFEIDITPAQSEELLRKNDFAFLFAPLYHGAMKYAAPARKALKVKTIMNLLGPLANPAGAEYQIIGVYSAELAPVIAEAARMLGVKRGMIVHGRDGEDELSVCDTSLVVEFDEEKRNQAVRIRSLRKLRHYQTFSRRAPGRRCKNQCRTRPANSGRPGDRGDSRCGLSQRRGGAVHLRHGRGHRRGLCPVPAVIKIWKGSTENRGNNIPFTSAG